MNHFPVLLLRNLHAPCASQARACVLCAKQLQCCCPRTWPARDTGAMQREAKQTLSSHFTLHSSHPTLHTSHLHLISTHLIWALLISFHFFPYISKVLLGYFHVIWAQLNLSHLTGASLNSSRLFCTSESLRHRCTLHSLHRVLPSSTWRNTFHLIYSIEWLMPSVHALHQISTASLSSRQLIVNMV